MSRIELNYAECLVLEKCDEILYLGKNVNNPAIKKAVGSIEDLIRELNLDTDIHEFVDFAKVDIIRD